jgi:hypothetical protein
MKVGYLAAIVAASNAGGAGSVVLPERLSSPSAQRRVKASSLSRSLT